MKSAALLNESMHVREGGKRAILEVSYSIVNVCIYGLVSYSIAKGCFYGLIIL